MPKITGYKIVEAHNAQILAEFVRTHVDNGWEPHGSLVYGHCHAHSSRTEDSHYYAQPIVLRGKAVK